MLTVLDAIKLATEYFEKKEIQSARVNAEMLLSHTLNCKRLDLYLLFDRPLIEDELNKYREFIARRGKYEPVQYIIGSTEFYCLTFKINKSVLIPRPETEILVEEIINNYKNFNRLKILDIGCGSGNIAISLAKNLPNTVVTTIDISEEAIDLAKENAVLNSVENISFIRSDINQNSILGDIKFDLIVSNPPYVGKNDYEALQKEITLFEPRNAVTDEGDGYSFYESITQFSKQHLVNGGKIYFEIAKDQSERVKSILSENDFHEIKIVKDYQQIDRVISGVKK